MALVTYLTRCVGLWAVPYLKRNQWIEPWLKQLPGTLLVSFLSPMLFELSMIEWPAVIVTAICAYLTKNIFASLIAGVGVALISNGLMI